MNLLQHLYKIFSYVFIGFIVVLITLTFGMPDFVSSSAGSGRYLAAEIGDEVLTKLELSRVKENFIRQRYEGKNLPDGFKKSIEEQLFNQLIQNKVNLILLKNIGLYPISRSKKRIMVDYLKENFPSYFTKVSHDFKKFEVEVLRRNQIGYSEFESDVVDGYASQYVLNLLEAVQSFSNPEKILLWDAKQIQISYQVSIMDQASKNKILKRKSLITEMEIQKKFKSDYLSRDKHAKLTQIKRQAIKDSLYREKKKKLEQDLLQEIRESLKKKSLRGVASHYGLRVYSINKVSLSEKLDDQKPAGAPSMAPLEKSSNFRDILTFGKINQTRVISEGGKFYLITVTRKLVPNKKNRENALQKVDALKQFLNQNAKGLSEHSDKISERYKTTITETITEIEKRKIKIKRFI